MRIARASVTNVKGFDSFIQEFGDVNLITGRNGEGKSSVLDIVYAALVTDGSRNLLKTGAEQGEILVVLEDDGETIEIRRILKPGEVSAPTVKSSKSGRIGAAARFLKEIVDTATIDPIRKVMTAPAKEQARILLETLPLDLNFQDLVDAVDGLPIPSAVFQKAKPLPALDAIKAVHDYIYDERKLVNRDEKTFRVHAQQLRAGMTAAPENGDWATVAANHRAHLEHLTESLRGDEKVSLERYWQEKATIDQESRDLENGINADINAKIEALEKERRERLKAVEQGKADRTVKASEEHQARVERAQQEYTPKLDAVKAELAQAEERANNETVWKQKEADAQAAEKSAADAKAKSEAMTAALKSLDGVREKLLEKLPIKGLRIEGGQAFLNDVPLEEVNTAERAKFWVRVAAMRAMNRDLGVVVIDDCEHFDTGNWAILLDACKQSGLQFFLSRVEDHEFRVETI